MNFETFLIILEFIGAIAFAISGALIAIENKMDLLGVILLGTTTAVGGGLFRDIIIGRSMP
ncbi:MAG: TRIC cation channel family protein, partial [Anaeroplasmataceae bacterium]|nr:TRIC cation channel family protein [Anaeroplasmataceae bacterium]